MALNSEIANAFSLEGRVAVITGGGSGLGQEVARVFALAGAKLVLVGTSDTGLDATRKLVGETPTWCERVDVSLREEVEALADRIVAQAGSLDIWVNCAAVGYIHPLLEVDPERAERVVAVNLMGSYWGCAAAGRVMRDLGGGAIVNFSSGGGSGPVPNVAIYGMTKAAVNSLTWTSAAELGPYGIRVNAISPGWFETPMSSAMYRNSAGEVDPALREALIEDITRRSPLGIRGQASDIGYACLFLASDASRYITGHVLPVSGGSSSGRIG